MSSFWMLWGGIVVIIAFSVVGLAFSLVGGMTMDRMHNAMATSPGLNITEGSQWATGAESNVLKMENIFFMLAYIFPVLGLVVGGVMIHRSTAYDKYQYYRR